MLTPILRICHLFKTTYATLGACQSSDPIWWCNFLRRGRPLKGGRTVTMIGAGDAAQEWTNCTRTSRLSTFYYCRVVKIALLRSLSTYILVQCRVIENYTIKLSNISNHWKLSMPTFRFCETYLLHIKPFVFNKSAQEGTGTQPDYFHPKTLFEIWLNA